MIIRNFYKDKYERLKLRKRYKLKVSAINSSEEKYIIYVFRSNKHLYLQLVIDGYSIVSVNTIQYKKGNTKFRRQVIMEMIESFHKRVNEVLKNYKLSQFLYDISYYKYQGCVKLSIDYFRELVQKQLSM